MRDRDLKKAGSQSEVEDHLKQRLRYENMVADISTLAIASEDLNRFQQKCLEILGNTLDVSRTYVFEHRYETDTMDNTFEWFAPGISPQKENLQGIPTRDAPWWVEMMRANRIINCRDIEELPYEAEKNILRAQQIKSVLVVPLFVKKAYYGFMGFDECRYHREWPSEDVALLKTVSEIIGMVLEREQDRHALIEKEALLSATIDSLPFDLFIIGKDGRYSIINSIARRWGDAVGKRPDEIMQDEEILRSWRENNRRAFSGETVRGEVEYDINGNIEQLYNIISPVRIGNEVNAIVGINIDITDRKRMEEELRASERRYRDLVENMSEVVFVIDRSGRISYVSPGVLNLSQYSPTMLTGHYAEEFIYKEDLPRFRKNMKEALAAEQFTENEYRILAKSGDIRWMRTSARPVYDGSKIIGLQGLLVDITERKQAEEALRKSEALLSATEQLTKVGGWEFDTGKQAMFWTEEVYRIHDFEPGEITPGSPDHIAGSLQCYDPEDRPVIETAFRRCAETGEPYDLEFPFTTAKGRRLWIRTTARPVYEDGKIVQILGNIMDITERKQAEEALRENEERFRAIFDNAAVGMALTSMSGHILKANEAFCRFLGYSSEELADMHFSELTHPQDLNTDTNLYKDLIEGVRTCYMLDKRYLRKDGEVVWGRLGLSVIRGIDGRLKYGVGTCEDITDRKRAEEALKRAKEELEIRVQERTAELSRRAEQLARLSTKLTLAEQQERSRIAEILHGHLQQLLVGAKIEQEILIHDIDKTLKPAAEHVLDLVNQSIHASRSLSMELSPPVLRSEDFSAALKWLARWMRENHGLEVKLETGSEIVLGRKDLNELLFQSVRELLLNVSKHAGVKSATVTVEQQDRYSQIIVRDGGMGFDPETLWKKTDTENKFGLLTIRERLTLMGGNLEINSSHGKGSSFSMFIPFGAQRIGEKFIRESIPETRTTDASGEKIRVLIVDDHTVVRQGISSMLNLHPDIEVAGDASDGEEAGEKARELQPDVILMDINMPRMNGVEATRVIHSEFPHIRIIGLSMYDDSETAKAVLNAGAVIFLTKSGHSDDLLSAIRGSTRH